MSDRSPVAGVFSCIDSFPACWLRGVQVSSGRVWSGRSMFPRQAPVSWSRDSMYSLKFSMSLLILWVRTPSLSATFSTKPSGSMSICAVTRVWVSSKRWKVITPAWLGPASDFQAMRSSGVLFGDGGVEFSYLSGYFEDPMCVHVVGLSNFPYSGHEVGERFELGPLVVGGTDGDVDIYGFGHGTHDFRATHSVN